MNIDDRYPRKISFEEIKDSDYVVTMGFSIENFCPANWSGENFDWDLNDTDGKCIEEVVSIQHDIRRWIGEFFDRSNFIIKGD